MMIQPVKSVRPLSPKVESVHEPTEKKHDGAAHHGMGALILFPLLTFHILCFIVLFSLGIGVGILASELHQILWDLRFHAFWQTYVTLISLVITVELFFRVGFDTTLNNWMHRQQAKHWIELYFVPRGLYFLGYMTAVCLLYYAYQGAHIVIPIKQNSTNTVHLYRTPNFTRTTTTTTTPPPPNVRNSTFDGDGDDSDNWKNNPLSLAIDADHFHYSMIFFTSLCYMVYTISKENDWITHRRTVMQNNHPDPAMRGGVGNFVLFLAVHLVMTCIYGLPLVGAVFLARQFVFGSILTYSTGIALGILVGIGAMYMERRRPFPSKRMNPPAFAFENHLRIRIGILQLILLPFAAGRYFDANRTIELDSQNDDFLMFTFEVAIGVVQAVKVIGSDVFLLKAIYFPNKSPLRPITSSGVEGDDDSLLQVGSLSSIASVTQSTQTVYDEELESDKEEEEEKDETEMKPEEESTEPETKDKEEEPEPEPVSVPKESSTEKSSIADINGPQDDDDQEQFEETDESLQTEPSASDTHIVSSAPSSIVEGYNDQFT